MGTESAIDLVPTRRANNITLNFVHVRSMFAFGRCRSCIIKEGARALPFVCVLFVACACAAGKEEVRSDREGMHAVTLLYSSWESQCVLEPQMCGVGAFSGHVFAFVLFRFHFVRSQFVSKREDKTQANAQKQNT